MTATDTRPLAHLTMRAPLSATADTQVWSAVTDTGAPVAVRAMPAVDPARQQHRDRRLDLVSNVEHPGLARILPQYCRPEALVSELIIGPNLATVRAGRNGLSVAESLTLARSLADAVAALHAVGAVHGDVSPGNVLFRTDGDGATPVLVDLVADLGWEAGTSGFAAPEVRAGHVATPAADVWSVATLSVWAAHVGARDAVTEALAAALAADPAQRPTAASLATAPADAEPELVRLPTASVLAGASVREQAQRAATVLRPTRRRRRPRHRKFTPARLARVVAAVMVALAIPAAWHWWPQPPPQAPTASDLAGIVVDLVQARDAALILGDEQALAAVTVPQSQAAVGDAEVLDALQAEGATIAGLATTVSDARPLQISADTALISVTLSQSAYERTVAGVTESVPAAQPRCTQLRLRLDDTGWRVEAAAACGS